MVWFTNANAQFKETKYALSVQGANAWLWAHSNAVNNIAGSGATGISIDLNRYRLDQFADKYCKNGFVSGFHLSYYKFSFDTLGSCFNIGYFVEPNLISTTVFKLGLRASGGATIGTNPYDRFTNPANVSYSSYLNGFLALGLRFNLNVSQKIAFQSLFQLKHFSSGGLNNPNFGVNFLSASAGIAYSLGSTIKPLKETLQDEKWRYDAFAFTTYKNSPHFKDRFYWVTGGGFNMSRKVSLINAISVGAEIINDNSFGDMLITDGYFNNKVFRIGVLAGHEFIFNKMMFSQHLGYYAFSEIPYFGRLYHRWGINYKLHKKLWIGTNLLATAQKAQFLDFRLMYSIYR